MFSSDEMYQRLHRFRTQLQQSENADKPLQPQPMRGTHTEEHGSYSYLIQAAAIAAISSLRAPHNVAADGQSAGYPSVFLCHTKNCSASSYSTWRTPFMVYTVCHVIDY